MGNQPERFGSKIRKKEEGESETFIWCSGPFAIGTAFSAELIVCNNKGTRFGALIYDFPGFRVGGFQPGIIFDLLTKNPGFQVGLDQVCKQHIALSVGVQLLPQFQRHPRI